MKENNFQPPKWAVRFLKGFCPDPLYEEIEGDLIQKFAKDITTFEERKAKRRLAWNTIWFFPEWMPLAPAGNFVKE